MTKPRVDRVHQTMDSRSRGLGLGVAWIALALGLLDTSAGAAPPLNDAFVNRLTLTTGVATHSTTVGASVESNEPTPFGVPVGKLEASLWWSWTAPSNGWYEATTIGSLADTVLTIATGNSLDELTIVQVNDNDGILGIAPAHIGFPANAGTVYALAVSSSELGANEVALKVSPTTQPSPLVRAVGFSPQPLNVANALSTGFATVTITSSNDLLSGRLRILSPVSGYSNGLAGFTFGPAQLISGNSHAGTYRIPLPLPPNLGPGSYLWQLSLIAGSSERATFGPGSNTAIPTGLPLTCEIINSGTVDFKPPSITSVEVTPLEYDTSSIPPPKFTLKFRATDDLSGVYSVDMQWVNASGGVLTSSQLLLGSNFRISGTPTDGIYQISNYVTHGNQTNAYRLRLQARDFVGNTAVILDSTEPNFPGPFEGAISVRTPSASQLTQVSLAPTAVDVTSADRTVVATADLTALDTVLGVTFSLRTSVFENPPILNAVAELVSGTPTAGRWQAILTVPQGYLPGRWPVTVLVQPRLTQADDYGPFGSRPLPASATQELIIRNDGLVDLEPPQVDVLRVSPRLVFTGPCPGIQPVNIRLRVKSNGSGVSDESFVFLAVADGSLTLGGPTIDAAHRVAGDFRDGVYELSLNVPFNSAPGNYIIVPKVQSRTGFSGSTAGKSPHLRVAAMPAALERWTADNFKFEYPDCRVFFDWAPLADQDLDRRSNYGEAYFNSNPSFPDLTAQFTVTRGLDGLLVARWIEPENTYGLAMAVEWSPDLELWLEPGESENGVAARAISMPVSDAAPGGGHYREARIDTEGLEQAFLRLRVTVP